MSGDWSGESGEHTIGPIPIMRQPLDDLSQHLLGVALLIEHRDPAIFQADTAMIRAAVHERLHPPKPEPPDDPRLELAEPCTVPGCPGWV